MFVTFVLHLYHSHLSHLTPYLFQIFITTLKMEDQRGIITIDIISLIISMIITEEQYMLCLLFGIAFHLQLVLLSYHPIFLRPYHFLKLVSFLGANRTKSASVCLWL